MDVVALVGGARVLAVGAAAGLIPANDVQVAVVGDGGVAAARKTEVVGVGGESTDTAIGVDGGVLDVVATEGSAGVLAVGATGALIPADDVQVAVVGQRGVVRARNTEVIGIGGEGAEAAIGIYGGVLDVVAIFGSAGVLAVGVTGGLKPADDVQVAVVGNRGVAIARKTEVIGVGGKGGGGADRNTGAADLVGGAVVDHTIVITGLEIRSRGNNY